MKNAALRAGLKVFRVLTACERGRGLETCINQHRGEQSREMDTDGALRISLDCLDPATLLPYLQDTW